MKKLLVWIKDNLNEVYIDRDIMVLANPEIAKLPAWVMALVAAGGLAAGSDRSNVTGIQHVT